MLLLALSPTPLAAHGAVPVAPDAVWSAWSLDPLVIAPLLLVHWLYGRGVLRLWARAGHGRGIGRSHVAAFVAAELALFVALVSPVDALGGVLLSAHMVQHGLLVVIAPPLLVMARPGVALTWAMPAGWLRGPPAVAWRKLAQAVRRLARPAPAALLHGLTVWLWHAPALFEAALARPWLHWLEHATFLATAMLLWQSLLSARGGASAAAALAGTFATLMHTGLLGGLLTLAPEPLYRWYAGQSELWGLSPLSDQQLAGLIMWVPMGLAYLAAALWLAARLVSAGGRDRAMARA